MNDTMVGDQCEAALEAEAVTSQEGERPHIAEPPNHNERSQFRSLLVANPNYFGNLSTSPFKPAFKLQGDTTYERLVCVGLNPVYNRLEAVVQVNQNTGYGGDICSFGSREYVRFYVDLFNDGVWHDVGLASVGVHDIPGKKPLCYAVRRDFSPFKKFCVFENIVRVRAILQWDAAPPANTPGYSPIWGNVVNVHVQIQPSAFWLWGDLLKYLKPIASKIPDPIGPVIDELDPAVKLTAIEPQPLTLLQKKELYKNKNVPVHRFAFQEAHQLLKLSNPNALALAGQSPLTEAGLSVSDLGELIGKFLPTDGDTTYEQLRCVGLYPEFGLIEAVLTVKAATGFSGPLCSSGSTEYIAFWIDFQDGAGFQYMGTSTVNVHDLTTIKEDGVQYRGVPQEGLVQIPGSLRCRPASCPAPGHPSWETPPPPANPNYVPVSGNREECLVQLYPSALVGHVPLIETVGDIGVNDIGAAGLATGDGQIGHFSVLDSPFGGVVTITGHIGDPPDSFGGGAVPYN